MRTEINPLHQLPRLLPAWNLLKRTEWTRIDGDELLFETQRDFTRAGVGAVYDLVAAIESGRIYGEQPFLDRNDIGCVYSHLFDVRRAGDLEPFRIQSVTHESGLYFMQMERLVLTVKPGETHHSSTELAWLRAAALEFIEKGSVLSGF